VIDFKKARVRRAMKGTTKKSHGIAAADSKKKSWGENLGAITGEVPLPTLRSRGQGLPGL